VDSIAMLVEEAMARGVASAAALSIGDGGREVARLVRGHTHRVPALGEPIDEQTPFDLASLTKPIATVASAMVLAGDGRLDLAAPVRRWLPDATTTGTVKQLIGHAAGCIAHVEFFRAMRVGEHPEPYRELIARAATEPANPPGVATVYSDLGFLQLGAIVERAADLPLRDAFASLVAEPLGLEGACYPGTTPLAGAVATEYDELRGGIVCGLVHDENAYYGGGVCGHAGLFAPIGDVARFAAAICEAANGTRVGRFVPEVVQRFVTESPIASTTWRLGWDTPSHEPGVSQAGDKWPRTGAIGHTGFTGTSLWLDLPRKRWVALLANRVHPTREGTADAIKALRRAVGDATVDLLH
jgi:CubicO group peptidase (beta-lactamase class C family)